MDNAIQSPKGFRDLGLQDKNIGAPGLHNISFEAPGFIVIKIFRAPATEIIGLLAPQQTFLGSRAPAPRAPALNRERLGERVFPVSSLANVWFADEGLVTKLATKMASALFL